MDYGDIKHRFTYHPPSTERASKHEHIRFMLRNLAQNLNDILPESREKSLAVTKLEEAMMWANAALARSPKTEGT